MILGELERRGAFFLRTLAVDPPNESAYKNLHRAMMRLKKIGKVKLECCDWSGHPGGVGGLIVYRPGITVDEKDQWDWLKRKKHGDDVRWRGPDGELHVSYGNHPFP
jgi:hypothetical protein